MGITVKRTLWGAALGFGVALIIALLNGLQFGAALFAAAGLALTIAVIVAVLSWAVEYARSKGYNPALGFLLVFFLNILGIVILLLLPARHR